MAVCTIIGHSELYDADLDVKIEKAIAAIARQNEEIDFWFHRAFDFAYTVLMAVMRAKAKYSKKKITITLVDTEIRRKETQWTDLFLGWNFPPCVFDRLLVPPYADELQSASEGEEESSDNAHNLRVWRKIERWVLRESDYCLCYTYRELMESKTSLYQYAMRIKSLRMLDMTAPETTAFFRERVKRFPRSEYAIFCYWDQGDTLKSIGQRYGITGTAVERRLNHIRKKLRGLGQDRFKKMVPNVDARRCGFVLTGVGTEEECRELRSTIAYLHRNHGVREYWVKDGFLASGYYGEVKNLLERWRDSRLIVLTARGENVDELVEDAWQRGSQYCGVKYFEPGCKTPRARNLRTLKHIMDSTDYCVYSSAVESAFRDSIERHIRGRQPKVAFDIGNTDICIKKVEKESSELG